MNAALVESIERDAERLEREAADRVKAAREAARHTEAADLLDQMNRLYWSLDEELSRNGTQGGRERRVCWWVWRNIGTPTAAQRRLGQRDESGDTRHPLARVKPYKRASDLIRHVKRRVATLRELVADPWE